MRTRQVAPANPKQEIAIFLALLIALTAAVYTVALRAPGGADDWSRYMLLFMWTPGLAAILTNLALHRNVRGFGWRIGKPRYHAIAYFGPALVLFALFALVWTTGLGKFNPSFYQGARAQYGLPEGLAGSLGLVGIVALSAIVTMTSTLGEELGWRGFLVPRIHSLLGFFGTSVTIGLIWGAWHYPGIWAMLPTLAPELPLWYATLAFTWMTVGLSFIHTWLRLKSGSVWPSALFHAAGNSFGYAIGGATEPTAITRFVIPEYGIALPLVLTFFAYLCWKSEADSDR